MAVHKSKKTGGFEVFVYDPSKGRMAYGRCNWPLGSSEALSVRCARPEGHDGEHRSAFEREDGADALVGAETAFQSQIRLDMGGRIGAPVKTGERRVNGLAHGTGTEVRMPEDRTAPERRVYHFDAYVRVEATSQEEAWARIRSEFVYVSEADASDPEHKGDVNLTVTDLLDDEPLDAGPPCICPPDLLARGGFRGGCPVHG